MINVEQEVARRFSMLPSLVNAQENLVRRGGRLTAVCLIGIDTQPVYVTLKNGRIEGVEFGSFLLRSWDFAIKAHATAWLRHWEHKPAPGYHDLFAMAKLGEAQFEGNLAPFMANLQYIKDVLAMPRDAGGDAHE